MKKYFVTGLIILLPLALTLAIVIFVFNLLTDPFIGMVKGVFEYYGLFSNGFLFISANQLQSIIAQLIVLIILFFTTVILGLVTRWFFFHSFIRLADHLLHKIPVVNSIYKICQDIIKTIFTSETKSFKQVVLAPFPDDNIYSIGLVTREGMPGLEGTSHINAIAVFVPTTPNPTSGFLMMYKREDLIYLDMTIEDAFKYIISCGVIPPVFKPAKSIEAEPKL